MGHRSRMQSVELLDPVRTPDGPRPRVPTPVAEVRRRRRRWWWLGAVAAVAVVALVGSQSVLDARQRAELARFASVPGVVAPVGPGVRVAWRVPDALGGLVTDGLVADGAFVGLGVADDGSQSLVAVDERTGDVRWSTSASGPDPTSALADGDRGRGRCALAAGDRLVCLVGGGAARVVVVDARDGRVVADHPAPPATSMALLAGLAVLGAPGSGVTAQDLLTGAVRWRYALPGAGADLSQAAFTSSVEVFAAGDRVGVSEPGWSVALLDASGHVARTPVPAVVSHRFDAATGVLAMVSTAGAGRTRSTIVRAGHDDLDLPGSYLGLAVDDGSVPDLLLTSDVSLRGWDARTGALRWTSDEVATGPALVVRGRAYVPTMTGVVALDGRSGSLAWRSSVAPTNVPGSLATDGTAILVADQPVNGPGGSDLVAYGLDDGRIDWRAPLPAGVRSSTGAGRVLLGVSADGTVVLG